jgi:hypothetical protein
MLKFKRKFLYLSSIFYYVKNTSGFRKWLIFTGNQTKETNVENYRTFVGYEKKFGSNNHKNISNLEKYRNTNFNILKLCALILLDIKV